MPDSEREAGGQIAPERSAAQAATRYQRPFAEVAPMLAAALLLGAGGGLVFATILTATQGLRIPLGTWWYALVQAHGHLQIYGWIGLFVLGVTIYFLPRLRGAPLVGAASIRWVIVAMVSALVLRAISQPLVALTDRSIFWRVLLASSGMIEGIALLWAVALIVATARTGPAIRSRPALWGVLPLVAEAVVALGLAACVNVANTITAATTPAGLVPLLGDQLNVTLGLLGFLVPMALAMSARSLPMFAGLDAFPRQALWPLASTYLAGSMLLTVGMLAGTGQRRWSAIASGLGMSVLGLAVLIFAGVLFRLMARRGRLPLRVRQLAPTPTAAERAYRQRVATERATYGPYVALIASAYCWASLGAVLLVVNGICSMLGRAPLANSDAVRHLFALGFVALLLCGAAPRLIPGFSGGRIRSAALVTATLWLGNIAVVLRVLPLLFAPALNDLGPFASLLSNAAFGLSGPLGLALGFCLAINLWPALFPEVTRAAK